MTKIISIMPIKLKNERLPGKNTMMLGEKPLLRYELDNLLAVEMLDSINVYCSDEAIVPYLPKGVNFIQRPSYLDLPTSNFTQIFECFMQEHDADIYVYAHATAPFIKVSTMKKGIEAVLSGKYDSAFCASKIQDYLWRDSEPLNFDASNMPRSQDLPIIYRETSGVYVFTKNVFSKYRRRIGMHPYIMEVSFKESVDINLPEDFEIAKILLHYDI